MKTKTRFHKLTAWLLTLAMLMTFIPSFTLTASAAESLTDSTTNVTLTSDTNGYYQIGTAEALIAFANLVNGGNTSINGILTADITLNENLLSKLSIQTSGYQWLLGTATVKSGNTVTSWTPIGSKDAPYTGSFDGNGKTISGLYFNENNETNGKYSGVFRSVSGGTIKNLKLSDSYINGYWWVGGIVGLAINSEISGCSVEGGWVMSNNAYVGAIVGKAEGSCTISNCSSNCFINGSSHTGGIVGALFGTDTDKGLISNCTNTSTFYDLGRQSGGIVGEIQYGSVENCTNTSALSSNEGDLGGIVGAFRWSATVQNCHNKGNISSTFRGYVGGVAGSGEYSVSMIKCSNTGSISASDIMQVGGVIGRAYDADITNCYSVGIVTSAGEQVGGVVGFLTSSSTLTGCYSSGAVTGATQVGGILGQVSGSTVKDNTYDLTKHTGDMFGDTYSIYENILENNMGYSTADYTSGKVCYIMNGSTSEGELVWGQTLVSENTPNFTGRTVYYDAYTDPQYWNDRPETKYTVSFAANGGSGTMASTEVAASTNYALPECGFTAPEGKEFKAWSVDGVEYAVGDQIFITGATTVSAVWKDRTIILYSVAVTPSDNGSVKADLVSAEANSTVTLTITPDTYYQIGDISITDANGGTVQLSGSTFTMPASDVTVTVSFERIQYQVSFASGGGSGSMSAVMANAGEEYTLPTCTFTAPYGKMFKAWKIDNIEYAVGDKISLTAAVTVTAVWQNIPEAMWGASADSLTGGGTLTEALNAAKNDSSIKYIKLTKGVTGSSFAAQGGEFVLDLNGNTITAASDTYNVAFDVGSNAVITMKNGTVSAPESSYSDPLSVNGKLKLENVTLSGSYGSGASIGFGGTVDLSGYTNFSGITVCYLSESGELILPDGYALMSGSTVVTEPQKWTVYTIGKAPTVTKYTVMIDSNIANGTVEADVEEAAEGDTVTLTVTPDDGYELNALTVSDGTNSVSTTAGSNNTYTFTMPAANITVSATFKPKTYVAEVTVGGTATKYETLAEAYAFASGKTAEIKLLTNVTEDATTSVDISGGNVTLNMNGYNITTTQMVYIRQGTDFTITGTGKITYTREGDGTPDGSSNALYAPFRLSPSQSNNNAAAATMVVGGNVTIESTGVYTAALGIGTNNASSPVKLTIRDSAKLISNNSGYIISFSSPASANKWGNCEIIIEGGSFENKANGYTVGYNDTYYDNPDELYHVYIAIDGITVGSGLKNVYYKLTNSTNAAVAYTANTVTHGENTYGLSSSVVTLTATAQSGVTIGKILANTTEATLSEGVYSFTMPNKLVTLTAETSAAATTYTVTVDSSIQNGTVTANPTSAAEGDTVTLTVTPDDGYELDTLTVKDADDGDVTVTDNKFTMPAGDVTITATFKPTIVPHVHNWKYELDGTDTIKATCTADACPNTDGGSIIIAAPDSLVYTGSAIEAKVTNNLTTGDTVTVVYTAASGSALTDNKPVNVGTYTASITMGEGDNAKTASVTYTIEKATLGSASITVTAPAAGAKPQTTVTAGTGYTAAIEWSETVTQFGFNTAYTATVTLTADSNHKFASTLAVDGWTVESVSTDGTTATLTKTFDATSKAKLTELTSAPANQTLNGYYTEVSGAIAELPTTVTYTTESGDVTVDIEWTCSNYNSTTNATNTFAWSVKDGELDDYDVNNIKTSGTITVTNVDALPVTNTGSNAEITYDGNTYNVSEMFTKDENAGEATYTIADGGTGAGTLNGSTLTITKAGTIKITMTTAANGTYANGSATATLTVAKGTGEGSVTMDGWTYGGTASNPVAQSATNGTGNVTYQYKVKDAAESTYSESKPSNAGNYTVKAIFAATDLYNEVVKTDDFTIAKATPSYTVPTNLTATYGQTLANVQGLTTRFAFMAENTTSVGNAGNNTFKLKFTPADTNNYNVVENIDATVVVAQKEIGIEWGNTEFTYNKTEQKPAATATGLEAGDSCTITVTGGQTNAGNNYPATAQSLSNANYKLPASKTTTFNIAKRSVTITGVTIADTKVYDRDTDASITNYGSVSNVIDGDIVTVDHTSASATYNDKNVGNSKTVTFAGFAITGTNAANYVLSGQPESQSANITPKAVTITGVTIAATKIYDGNATASITNYGLVDGVISGDTITVNSEAAAATYSDANAGTDKAVTFTGFAITGAEAANYELSAQPASTTANITAKNITGAEITLGTALTYNGSELTQTIASATIDGLAITYNVSGNVNTNAGEYTLTIEGYDNFTGTEQKTYTIAKADATLGTAPAAITPLTYNTAEQTLVSAGENVAGGTLMYKLGDGEYSAELPKATNVGTYTVYYKVVGDSNHNDIAEQNFTVAIAEKVVNTAIVLATPAPNQTPVTSIETDEYTAVITWSPTVEDKFAYSTDYTATIIITPKANYTLTGIAENGYTIEGATVTNSADSGVITAVFPKTGSRPSSGGGGVTRYTVKFDTDGGNTIASKTVTRNSTVDEPTVPEKEGYAFMGWFADEDFATAYDFDSKVTKNITLYAKWEKVDDEEPENTGTHNCPSKAFDDLDISAWYHLDTDYVLKKGIFRGISEKIFEPNSAQTRAMMVTVLWRIENEPVVNYLMTFEDADAESWYGEAVRWAASEGIIKGYSETEFGPDDSITREQIAAIMHRYAKYKGYDVSVGENTNILSYNDFDNISEYAIAPMQWAVGSGLIKGKSESTLNPLDNATRAEIAAILHRFIEANK